MAVDRGMYEKAVAAVKSGSAPDDVLDGLMDIIDEYESASPKTPTNFGEGGSILGTGPTGLDAIESKMPASADDKVIGLMGDKRNVMAATADPKMRAHDVTPEALERRTKRDADRVKNAEYIPPPKPAAPMGGVDPVSMFSTAVDNARSNLPVFAGGKVTHFLEPPISQFRRDMARRYGPEVRKMDHTSPEYLDYADQRWQEVLDQAKAEGVPVVRNAYRVNDTMGKKVESAAARAIGAGTAAAVGADEAAFFGLGQKLMAGGDKEQLENYQRLAESNPAARLGGNIVGGASSIGAGGLASRAIGGQGLARGLARGAAAGAATETSLAASQDRLPGIGELATGAALGAPFGALGGMLGKNLRETTRLGDIERSGLGETEVLRGVRRSPRAVALRERAAKELGSPDRTVDMMAGELEGPMLDAGRRLADSTQADIGKAQQTYFNMTKDVKRPTTPLLKEAMKLHAGGSYEAGGQLPAHAAQNRKLAQIIADSSAVDIEAAANGKAIRKAANPQSFDLTPEEAAAQGIDVDRHIKAMLKNGAEAPGDFVVRVTPKEMNPEQTENVIRILTEQMGEGKNVGALESMQRASREVRDQFPAMGPAADAAPVEIGVGGQKQRLQGWSAFQSDAARRTGDVRRTLEMSGLPQGELPASLNAGEAQGQFGAISNYRKPGRHPDADSALRELAGLADKGRELEDLAGMRGLEEARGGLPLSRKAIAEAGRYRLDPLLQFYAPSAAVQAPGAMEKLRGQPGKLDEQLDEDTLRILRNYLNPTQPRF